MRYLLLLLALIGTPSFATKLEATTDTGVIVTLLDTPCINSAVLALLKPERHQFYQAGRAKFPTRTYELCWRVTPDRQYVRIIDEEGDGAEEGNKILFPIGMFAPKETI